MWSSPPDSDSSFELFQRDLHVRHVLETAARVLAQAARNHALELLRHVPDNLARGLRLVAQDGRQRREPGVALERPATRHHLVEHGAKAENVRPPVDLPSFRLLRRHVRDRPDNHPLSVPGFAAARRSFAAGRRGTRGVLRQAWPDRSRGP